MTQRRFEVSEIHCRKCQQTIERALGDVACITGIESDVATNVVTVEFDQERLGEHEIEERLAEAGFAVVRTARDPDDSATDVEADARSGVASRYGLLTAAVLAIALAGYVGYALYPRFELPAVQGAGLFGLAAAAGVASFFSPCSFPLLLGLLGRQTVREADGGARSAGGARTVAPAVFGGALALGAAVFMILAGMVIGLGGEALFAGATFTSTAGITIRATVGTLLVVLGLMQTGRVPLRMHAVEKVSRPLSRRSAALRREHPVAGFGLFGFGYVLAGFG